MPLVRDASGDLDEERPARTAVEVDQRLRRIAESTLSEREQISATVAQPHRGGGSVARQDEAGELTRGQRDLVMVRLNTIQIADDRHPIGRSGQGHRAAPDALSGAGRSVGRSAY